MVGVAFLVDFIAVGFFFYSFGIYYPAIVADLGVSATAVASGIAVSNFVSGLFAPFVGQALDRYPLKRMMLLGSLVVSAGFLCLSQVRSVWQYYLVLGSFFAFGLSLMGGMASSKLVANWYILKRGTMLGRATMGVSLSGIAMPFVATWLVAELGWRGGFGVYAAGILVLVLPVVALLVVTRPEDVGQHPDGRPPLLGRDGEEEPEVRWRSRELLRSRNFWMIAMPFGAVFASLSAILIHVVPYANDLGYDGFRAAAILQVAAGAGVAGKVVFGQLFDRGDPRVTVWLSFGIQIAGLVLLLLAGGYPGLVAGGLVFGFGMGGVVPLQGAVCGRAFGRESFGTVLGLIRPVQVPIHALGIPLAAWVHDTTGSFQGAFLVFLAVYVASCAMIGALRLPRARPLSGGEARVA